MCSEVIERVVAELCAEAARDYVDVTLIAETLREDLNLRTQYDIRRHTLDVIGRLMTNGVYPGDYSPGAILSFWPGERSEHLRRIDAEWTAMGKTPTLAEPICWFGVKPEKSI